MKSILLISLAIFLHSCKPQPEPGQMGEAPPPMPVKVEHAKRLDLEITRAYSGRFAPVERAEVRARVSGFIAEIHYREGQQVEAGDLLVTLDPALFDAAVSAARARIGQAEAALSLATLNEERADRLLQSRSISQEEFDSRKAELARTKADYAFAEAMLREAELERSYTEVTAPISGKIGRREVTVGNYASGGTSTAPVLTTIVPQSPLYFEFEVDERQASALPEEIDAVEIQVTDEKSYSGELVFRDNTLSRSSATLMMRVLVTNEDGDLQPGVFGRVILPVDVRGQKLVVPETALGFEQQRRYAWVIGTEGMPEKRYLEVGELIKGERIVLSGLGVEERIAVSAVQMIRPGFPVEPVSAESISVEPTSAESIPEQEESAH